MPPRAVPPALRARQAKRNQAHAASPASPPDPELRQRAHAILDKILEDYPETSTVMIVVADAHNTNAASIPHSWTTKRGMIDVLYESIHRADE